MYNIPIQQGVKLFETWLKCRVKKHFFHLFLNDALIDVGPCSSKFSLEMETLFNSAFKGIQEYLQNKINFTEPG